MEDGYEPEQFFRVLLTAFGASVLPMEVKSVRNNPAFTCDPHTGFLKVSRYSAAT